MEIYLIPGEPGFLRNGVGLLRTTFERSDSLEAIDPFFEEVRTLLQEKHAQKYGTPDFFGVMDLPFAYTGFKDRDQRGQFGLGVFKKYADVDQRFFSAACYYNCGFLYKGGKQPVLLETVEPDPDLVRQASQATGLPVSSLLVLADVKYDDRLIKEFIKSPSL